MLIRALCQNLGNKNMLKVKASSILKASIDKLAAGFFSAAMILFIGLGNVHADGMGGASLGQQNSEPDPDDPCDGKGNGSGTSSLFDRERLDPESLYASLESRSRFALDDGYNAEPILGGGTKPVSMFSGAENYRHIDLSLPGVYPIKLIRKYDSKTIYDSPLGFGWAFNHDRRLFEYKDLSVIIRKGCGERAKFVYTGGTYVTPAGTKGELASDGNGGFVFTFLNGNKHFYDQQGRFVAQQDAIGNRNEFSYSATKLPLIGTSNYSIDPSKPMVVAFHYQLNRIESRQANGSLTGRFIDFTYDAITGRLNKAKASDGQEVNYLHQVVQQDENSTTNGNLVKVTLANQIIHNYQYNDANDSHNLTYIQEGTGAIPFVNTYSEDDKVIAQQYGNSSVAIDFTVDFKNATLTQTIVDDEGKVVHAATEQYEFNSSGYLLGKTNDSGQTVKRSYDGQNREIATERWINDIETGTPVLQQSVEYGYDSRGNRTLIASYNGTSLLSKAVSTFNDNNQVITRSVIAPDGETRTTTYTYNTDQTLKSVDGPRTDVNDITTYAYYTNKSLKSVTNALNQTVSFDNYNNDGSAQTITDANGIKYEFAFYPNGFIKTATNNGRVTTIEWDTLNRIKKMIAPSGQSITYEYQLVTDSNPQPIATQSGFDFGNGRTGSGFDMGGRSNFTKARYMINAIEDNLGNRIELNFDAFGNNTSYSVKNSDDKVIYQTSQIFDNLGQLFKQLGNNGQSNQFNYDGHGNFSSMTTALNDAAVAEFDSLNQLKKITDPLNGSTQFSYDEYQNLNRVIDATGKVTEYEYNAFAELTKLTSPDTGISTSSYNKVGQLLTRTDARGITVTLTYDALNRIKSETFANASENVIYEYDDVADGNKGIGRLTSVTDASGTTRYVYNDFGAVSKEIRIIDGKTYTTQYHFNTNGQLSSITYPSGRILTYTFDALGQVSGLSSNYQSQSKTLASNITYLPFGPMGGLTYGNAKTLTQSYDTDYRLTAKTVNGIDDLVYGYDLTDNIISISNGLNEQNNQTFSYNKRSQLEKAEGGYGELDYSYDAIGNRLTKTDNGTVSTYTYDENSHRLKSVKAAATTNIAHDAIGNTLTKGDLTFTYNQRGRLKTAAKEGMNTNYTYNYRGERVAKLVNGVKTHFIYNLNGQLIGEADSNGAIKKEYIYLNGQRFATIDGDTLYYVHTDHLGAPIALTDEAGVVQWKAHYTPFGKAVIDVDNLDQNIRFPGQYFDNETGLHYNYFRDYDPEIGRYIQSDPIGFNGGINTYAYVGGNPVNATDLYGLSSSFHHRRVTKNAIGWGYGNGRFSLPGEVQRVDAYSGSQLPENSFWHAMRDGRINPDGTPFQTIEQARALYEKYVMDNIASCTQEGLARALHAVQDSFMGGHEGFQSWSGGMPSLSHILDDVFPSMSRRRAAEVASRNILDAYDKQCECE